MHSHDNVHNVKDVTDVIENLMKMYIINITISSSSMCVGGGNYKRVAFWPLAWATLAKTWSIIGN